LKKYPIDREEASISHFQLEFRGNARNAVKIKDYEARLKEKRIRRQGRSFLLLSSAAGDQVAE
jgi:hypothetical protein